MDIRLCHKDKAGRRWGGRGTLPGYFLIHSKSLLPIEFPSIDMFCVTFGFGGVTEMHFPTYLRGVSFPKSS